VQPEAVDNEARKKADVRALAVYAALIIVPAVISMTAGSTAAFFGAIDLAGAYPVAVLWGLTPPLMAWRLSSRSGREGRGEGWRRQRVKLTVLAGLSIAFVGSNLVGDLAWLLPRGATGMAGRARWQ